MKKTKTETLGQVVRTVKRQKNPDRESTYKYSQFSESYIFPNSILKIHIDKKHILEPKL